MKNGVLSLLLFFFFFSCEKEEPFVVRNVTDNFSTTINISSDNIITGENPILSNSSLIDLSINDEISGYEDLILYARINSLSYEISNFNGDEDEALLDASIIVNGVRAEIDEVNLQNSDNNNQVFNIEDRYLLNQMAVFFRDSISGLAVLSTKLNDTNSSFDFNVSMNITVAIDVPQ